MKYSEIKHNIFLDQSLKAKEIKQTYANGTQLNFKPFVQQRKPSMKQKGSQWEWEKIFANDAPDKWLVFKLYTQLI